MNRITAFTRGLYDWIFEALWVPERTRTEWLAALFGAATPETEV